MGLRALISVSDKTGLSDFVKGLHAHGFTILSTGGTAKAIRDAGVPCSDVSEYTQSPEVMDGRVKTLHPRVHGGILMRDTEADREQLTKLLGGEPIDLVVVNLYPFAATVAKGAPFDVCIENIDIGGPTMVRAAAKNHARVTVLIEPSDYAGYLASLPAGPDSKAKSMYALKAFSHTATYDTAVAEWMQGQLCEGRTAVQTLKYGCNPHQKPASVRGLLSPQGPQPLPFTVLSGTPGYINLLDALNAWQLVRELGEATGLPAAASFKHVSPAGAAVYAPLTPDMLEVYEAAGKELSHTAIAYLRSRQADPLCSFGDFVAISTTVDASTAALLKIEVSDGIIAPGFEPEALEILKAKKGGKYIVLQADASFEPPAEEARTIFGTDFRQQRAAATITDATLDNVVTVKKELSDAVKRDLLVAQVGFGRPAPHKDCIPHVHETQLCIPHIHDAVTHVRAAREKSVRHRLASPAPPRAHSAPPPPPDKLQFARHAARTGLLPHPANAWPRDQPPIRRTGGHQIHAVQLGRLRQGWADGRRRRRPAVTRRLREAGWPQGGDVVLEATSESTGAQV